MEYPDDLYYSKEHVWVRVIGGRGKIGITEYAQWELGEIIFLGLPEEHTQVEQGDVFGSLESSKTVADLYAPVSGEIVLVNKDLEEETAVINDDPYGNGWLVTLEIDEPSQLDELLNAADYEKYLETQEKTQRGTGKAG